MVSYVPNRGDIVWLEFDPQRGKEIQKTRPALVISPQKYNFKTSLVLCMPITSRIKGYPFECIFKSPEINGAILCDQIRSLDWRARKARYLTNIPFELYLEIMEKLHVLLDDSQSASFSSY